MSEAQAPHAATIRRVTVYEDRADVVRDLEVDLVAGENVVVVEVPAVVSDAHAVVTVNGVAAHVDEVVIERSVVDDDSSTAQTRAALAAAVARLDGEVHAAERALKRQQQRRRRAQEAVDGWLALCARDVGRGGDVPPLADAVRRFQAAHTAVDDAVAAAQATLEDARLRRRLLTTNEPRSTGQRVVGRLVARVTAQAAGRAQLVVSTLLPCAAWRPSHEARLVGDRVEMVTHAAVWQRTGESWDDVELALSTARPSAGAVVPRLDEDRLSLRQKTDVEKKNVFVAHRQEAVPRQATQGQAPGIDDGGEARVFRAAHAQIPPDGRPHRVEVASFQAPCARERTVVPEVLPRVFLKVSLKNAGSKPLLAGPVTLVQDGAWVGEGDIAYVGVGEAFDLSFGSDDRFLVRADKRRQVDKKVVGKDVTHYIFEAHLAVASTTTERVTVLLRLPVSELKQLKVISSTHLCSDGEPAPDAHGLVRIPVDVVPGRERAVRVAFSFEHGSDVHVPEPW